MSDPMGNERVYLVMARRKPIMFETAPGVNAALQEHRAMPGPVCHEPPRITR